MKYEIGRTEIEAGPQSAITQFVDDIAIVYDGRLRALPEFGQTLNHEGKIPLDVSRYKRMTGVYVTEEASTAWGGDMRPDAITFTPKPFRRLGRENSRRKVFFGDLRIDAGGGDTQVIPVAVKPYEPGAFNHAVHEVGILQYLDGEDVPTLDVMGMVTVQDKAEPRSYMLTRYEPGLTTLDNTPWKQLDTEERWKRLQPAVDTAVELSTHAVFHGDLELKNVAHGETTGRIKVNDTEYSVSLRAKLEQDMSSGVVRRVVEQKMSNDLGTLCRSVGELVCDEGMTEQERFEECAEHVYEPYIEAVAITDTPYRDILLDAYTEVIVKKKKQAYGEWGGA